MEVQQWNSAGIILKSINMLKGGVSDLIIHRNQRDQEKKEIANM